MQFYEHFDLAEGCSALELVPASWQIETTHFRNGYSPPGARALFSCSMFSDLCLIIKKTCMGSLGFDRSPSKNLEKSLSCSQPRLYEGSSTCRSHRGFLRQGWYLEVQKFLCWSNKPTQWKQWFQISLSRCWASALCSGKRRQKGMVFISLTLQLQYNTYNVNALHAGLEGFFFNVTHIQVL